MRTRLKQLTILCASALLLACSTPLQGPFAQRAGGDDADQYYLRGRGELAAQHYTEAESAFRQALALVPSHVNARNGLASSFAEQGDYAHAIVEWRAMTDTLPEPASIGAFLLSNLGFAYFLKGDYAQAQEVLERSCLLDPQNYRAWRNLGKVLVMLGQNEQAARMFRQAEQLQDHDIEADQALVGQDALPVLTPVSLRSHTMDNTVRPAVGALAEQGFTEDSTPTRLEISNGNGVRHLAAQMARQLGDDQLRVVRLTNQKGFAVSQTRIEYPESQRQAAEQLAALVGTSALRQVRNCQPADMRLVLGHDLRKPQVIRPSDLPTQARADKEG